MSIAKRLLAVAAPVALCAAGCTDVTGPVEPLEQLPRQLSVAEEEVIQASNDFTFRLLREVLADDELGSGNVFLSPFSVSMALGMTLNGAAGETFDAIRATLGFADLDQRDINESYRDLANLLLGLDRTTELRIANSVWARQGHTFHDEFFGSVREYFSAQAQVLDFGSPDAKDVINGWVSEATNGRIPKIVEEISGNDLMFLINAVYFKGEWTDRFDPANTRPSDFHAGAAGGPVQVTTMHAEHMRVGLFSGPHGMVGGEIPYGNQAFTMVVLMPSPDGSIDEVVEALDADVWNTRMEQVRYVDEAAVALPKWEMEYEVRLDSALMRMGMGVAFGAEADFTRATPSGAHISRVQHKTFLSVDEEGTEAAAATSVVLADSLGPQLLVDRPFVVAIRERLSGTILFIGVIRDPR